jgi:hypothetical protein
MRMRHLLGLALILLAAAMVAGCGGDEKSNEPPQEIEDTLGFGGGDGAKEVQSRVENRIRDCMKAQGFDYVPVDPFAQQQAVTGKARISDEEFTRQFGYGISTLFGKGGEQANPNERIRASLSEADRAAYDRALYGENPVTFAEANDTGDFTELGGCTKDASEAAFGGAAVLSTLVEKLDELDERIIQDQRMVRANEKWAECMLEKGYRYEEPDEIDSDIEERFQSIVGSGVAPGTTTPPQGASYDRAALTELQREEVRIANADLDCEQQEIQPVEEVVRPQYEEQFRSQNQRLLAQVKKPEQSQ